MKILFITFAAIRRGGSSLRCFNMLNALAEAGHKIDLIAPGGCGTSMHANIRHLPACGGGGRIRLIYAAAGAYMRKSYDAVHAVDNAVFWAGVLTRWKGCRLVYDASRRFSGKDGLGRAVAWRLMPQRLQRLEKRMLKRADLVISTCESLQSDLERLQRVANIVQIEDIPLQSMVTVPRRSISGDEADFIRRSSALVFCSCVPGSHDGYKTMLLAARKVIEQVPCVGFVVTGCNCLGSAEIATKLDIQDNCLFLPGREAEDVFSLLDSCDAALFFPKDKVRYVQPEAYTLLQSGVPVVAVQNNAHAGILCEEVAVSVLANAESIASGLLRVILEPLFSRALASEAQRRVADGFTLSSFKHKVRKAYHGLQVADR